MPFDQNRSAPGTPRFGNTPPSVDRLPSPPPFNPPPQEPYFENPWGPSVDTNLPNPQFPQGDGTYGPSPPLTPVPLHGGRPIAGPPPMPPPPTAAEIASPFSEHYDPLPQSHDRNKAGYYPPLPPEQRAGFGELTPDQKRRMEEAAAFRPTGPPAAMDPRTR